VENPTDRRALSPRPILISSLRRHSYQGRGAEDDDEDEDEVEVCRGCVCCKRGFPGMGSRPVVPVKILSSMLFDLVVWLERGGPKPPAMPPPPAPPLPLLPADPPPVIPPSPRTLPLPNAAAMKSLEAPEAVPRPCRCEEEEEAGGGGEEEGVGCRELDGDGRNPANALWDWKIPDEAANEEGSCCEENALMWSPN
jgi:hypothetical protein